MLHRPKSDRAAECHVEDLVPRIGFNDRVKDFDDFDGLYYTRRTIGWTSSPKDRTLASVRH